MATGDQFPREVDGLDHSIAPQLIDLRDGDSFRLRIAPVAKRIGEATVRMLAYNGSVPGPTLRVPEGADIDVTVENHGDLETTVHWHGLRLDNQSDGTLETQDAIVAGGTFSCRVAFPDPGVYWYHPHIREDYAQELGLYGNVIVVPADPDYWSPVNRELAVTLDDILIEDGQVAPFSRSETAYSAMGRFGNVLLVNGDPELRLSAGHGEVVRLYLTNTANTRVFNVAVAGARMKVVGGDSGRCEREEFADAVILAPSERVVVDVLFDTPGEVTLEHRTPARTYTLALIAVSDQPVAESYADEFERLRVDPGLSAERERLAPLLEADPDETLAFVAEMDLGEPDPGVDAVYTCPMHPDVVSQEPGHCPICGMKLLARSAIYTCPMHPAVRSESPGRCPECGMKLLPVGLVDGAAHDGHGGGGEHAHGGGEGTADGIEWEDDMVEVNRMTTPANTRWRIIDPSADTAGRAPRWAFRVGDRKKIRLVNELNSDHPMHHPFHVHGAGRFLVLARDGVVEPNLVWSDTVLVRTGETVDIVLDVTNPGRWMVHCHIAEHHESGMHFSFDVEP